MKQAPAAERVSLIPWPPILFVGALAGGWALGRTAALDWPGLNDRPAHIIGLAFGIAGFALAVWAIATFIRAGTTVWPDGRAKVLVTDGPFRRLRNPMYLAEVLLLLGLAELTHNIWYAILAPVFALAVTWLAIGPEERHLEARFGDSYRTYKERTRRWL